MNLQVVLEPGAPISRGEELPHPKARRLESLRHYRRGPSARDEGPGTRTRPCGPGYELAGLWPARRGEGFSEGGGVEP